MAPSEPHLETSLHLDVKQHIDVQNVRYVKERERFRNPHKAFTYHMHGYEAVVGPVKGVLAKENVLKPREHALLIKERPSYVTILTLGMCSLVCMNCFIFCRLVFVSSVVFNASAGN